MSYSGFVNLKGSALSAKLDYVLILLPISRPISQDAQVSDDDESGKSSSEFVD